MVKSIFKRVIISVLVALILMLLKGSLISNVNAQSVYTAQTSDGSNFATCGSCSNLEYDYPIFQGDTLKGKDGRLILNLALYGTSTAPAYPQVVSRVRIWTGSTSYACEISSNTNQYYQSGSGTGGATGNAYTVGTYSANCPVHLPSNGSGVTKIQFYILGGTAGMSIYSPATFIVENNNEIKEEIQNNTNAINETNDILNNNDVSNDTNSSISTTLGSKTEQETFGPVADLLLLPLTLFRAFYNGFDNSCSTFNLGSLFGTQLSLPCINVRNILGAQLYNFIDMAISIFMILNIILFCIDIFDRLTSFEDPFNDLYSPKHTYHGRHENGGAYHG